MSAPKSKRYSLGVRVFAMASPCASLLVRLSELSSRMTVADSHVDL